jgi:hypothetical protein
MTLLGWLQAFAIQTGMRTTHILYGDKLDYKQIQQSVSGTSTDKTRNKMAEGTDERLGRYST